MMKTKIDFNIAGIYWGAVVVLLTIIPFLIVSKNYSNNIGFLVLVLIILVLFFVYASSIFIRSYWPAIRLYDDYMIDNHRVLALPRKIYKSTITSVEIKETTNRGGVARFLEICSSAYEKPLLLFDDRLTVTIPELYEIVKEWRD
ncbi:MAG: hypothetical protein PF481_05145 [Bacteroidales bacterium]|jgi:hypothetical protein|nr:hypothetical protein [Bacteroidales bacterium]